jgi:hypothetical protein
MFLETKQLAVVRVAPLEGSYPNAVAAELVAMMPPGVASIGLLRTPRAICSFTSKSSQSG